MNVLIACEFSGIIRDAFSNKGHCAWSCDLLASERNGNHLRGNILDFLTLDVPWDLMIAHPPCQYLSTVANRVWNTPGRAELREKAKTFFLALYNAEIPKICVENPVGYMNTVFRKPDQIIHPYYFREKAQKRTCLWLKGLPALKHPDPKSLTKPPPLYICKGRKSKGKHIGWCEGMRGVKDRGKARSRTFQGVANAMADQWG